MTYLEVQNKKEEWPHKFSDASVDVIAIFNAY